MREKKIQKDPGILEHWPEDKTYQEEMKSFACNVKKKKKNPEYRISMISLNKHQNILVYCKLNINNNVKQLPTHLMHI